MNKKIIYINESQKKSDDLNLNNLERFDLEYGTYGINIFRLGHKFTISFRITFSS